MGLGRSASLGKLLLLAESKLDDLIWRAIERGTGGGRSGPIAGNEACRCELGSLESLVGGGPDWDAALSDSRGAGSAASFAVFNRGEAELLVGAFPPTTDRGRPVERRLIAGAAG